MGKKKLTLEEVKSILKIEVDKSVLHIQHIETGTGSSGSSNGTGTSARFNHPVGITTDGTNLYVGDYSNHLIRKIE